MANSPDDNAAEISVSDARLLAQMLREFKQLKQSLGGATGVGGNDGRAQLPTARGWVRVANHHAIDGDDYMWRYDVEVFPHPFALLLDPPALSLATEAVGYNLLEMGNNTTGGFWGGPVVDGAEDDPTAACGTIYEILPIDLNYSEVIVEASLYWTYFESGDPTDGYWAWWFALPNMVNVVGPDGGA